LIRKVTPEMGEGAHVVTSGFEIATVLNDDRSIRNASNW